MRWAVTRRRLRAQQVERKIKKYIKTFFGKLPGGKGVYKRSAT